MSLSVIGPMVSLVHAESGRGNPILHHRHIGPGQCFARDQILLIHTSSSLHFIANLKIYPKKRSKRFSQESAKEDLPMKSPILFVLAMSAIVPLAAQAQNTNNYTFTSFDVPFPNSSNTKAFEINGRGDIVGRFFDSGMNGNPRGFLRHNDGTFAPPIDAPTANTGTVLRGI